MTVPCTSRWPPTNKVWVLSWQFGVPGAGEVLGQVPAIQARHSVVALASAKEVTARRNACPAAPAAPARESGCARAR
jgi:hypothetical protein